MIKPLNYGKVTHKFITSVITKWNWFFPDSNFQPFCVQDHFYLRNTFSIKAKYKSEKEIPTIRQRYILMDNYLSSNLRRENSIKTTGHLQQKNSLLKSITALQPQPTHFPFLKIKKFHYDLQKRETNKIYEVNKTNICCFLFCNKI